jgi:hypothetical protein
VDPAYIIVSAESESWVVPCNHGLFFEIPGVALVFINKNSVLISVFGISENSRVTSKAACGILISAEAKT